MQPVAPIHACRVIGAEVGRTLLPCQIAVCPRLSAHAGTFPVRMAVMVTSSPWGGDADIFRSPVILDGMLLKRLDTEVIFINRFGCD